MKREVLKSLALKAKNRMIHKGQGNQMGLTMNGEDCLNIKVISSDDELFYNKVRALMESDEDILNPIKKLMDENLMMKLNQRGKERYLLDTVEKYHKIRKQIEQENSCRYSY